MAKARRGRSAGGVNKSQAIKDYLNANTNAAPKAVVEALAAQGIEVSSQLVSNVKTSLGKKGRRGGRRGRRPGRVAAAGGGRASGGGSLSVQNLLDAKRVVEQVGSIDAVRKALDALESLKL